MTETSAYDPGEHTVEEVLKHLDGADDAERDRIFEAEKDGKARVGILDQAPFDPTEHTVDEVKAHLEGADDAERARVLDAEAAGKNRKGVAAAADEPAADTIPHSSFVDAAHEAASAVAKLADALAEQLDEVLEKHAAVIREHAPDPGEEPVWHAHNRVGFALTDVAPVIAALRATATGVRNETTTRGALDPDAEEE